jgi:hypothetical protein
MNCDALQKIKDCHCQRQRRGNDSFPNIRVLKFLLQHLPRTLRADNFITVVQQYAQHNFVRAVTYRA